MVSVYLRFARIVSERSTCARLKVGAVITTSDMEQVLALGYNGNAKGFPNECDSDEPGKCGCIHAEVNALIKCGKKDRKKVMFVTNAPCAHCAKLIVNSGFSLVHYLDDYRSSAGLLILKQAGITVRRFEEGIVEDDSSGPDNGRPQD